MLTALLLKKLGKSKTPSNKHCSGHSRKYGENYDMHNPERKTKNFYIWCDSFSSKHLNYENQEKEFIRWSVKKIYLCKHQKLLKKIPSFLQVHSCCCSHHVYQVKPTLPLWLWLPTQGTGAKAKAHLYRPDMRSACYIVQYSAILKLTQSAKSPHKGNSCLAFFINTILELC